MNTKRKILILLIFILILVFFLKNQSDWDCKNCNIILISIDTLGAKHLNEDTSPELIKLIENKGVSFTEAFSQSSWTLPSHISMLTGKNYEWDSISSSLPDRVYTIAEALYNNGYETQAFSTGPFVQKQWGLAQGFENFTGKLGKEEAWNDLPSLFDESFSWIESRKQQKPFFLFIHSFHVHDPYKKINSVEISRANRNLKEGNTEKFLSSYEAEINELDSSFKNLYDQLESHGLLENTIIVFTSDHGEEFGEHGSIALHGITTYRDVIHVPLIILHPNKKTREINYSVGVNQIPQTIFDILNLGIFSEETSLLKTTENQVVLSSTSNKKEEILDSYENRETILTNIIQTLNESQSFKFPEFSQSLTTNFIRSSIYGNWHLIQNPNKSLELFNMDKDPNEKDNLILKIESFSSKDKNDIQKLFKSLEI